MRRMPVLAVTAVVGSLMPWSLPAHAGGGCHEEVSQGSSADVKTHGNCFHPMVNTVRAGTTVTWLSGEIEHNVTGPGAKIGSNQLLPDRPVSIRFDVPGTYPYSCTLHAGMNGVIVVGDGAALDSPTAPSPTPAATDVDTVELAGGDERWTDSTAAVGGAGAGVLALGLVSGLALGRRRRADSD